MGTMGAMGTLGSAHGAHGAHGGHGAPLVMPVFPLRAAPPSPPPVPVYSPSRFHVDKRCQHRCSWKCLAISIICLCVLLAAMLAYFIGEERCALCALNTVFYTLRL